MQLALNARRPQCSVSCILCLSQMLCKIHVTSTKSLLRQKIKRCQDTRLPMCQLSSDSVTNQNSFNCPPQPQPKWHYDMSRQPIKQCPTAGSQTTPSQSLEFPLIFSSFKQTATPMNSCSHPTNDVWLRSCNPSTIGVYADVLSVSHTEN